MTDAPKFLGVTRRTLLASFGTAAAMPIFDTFALAASGSAQLAWTPGAATPQLAIGLRDKIWDQQGLTVEATPFPTGREALEALLNRGADFASLAEFAVTTAAMRAQNFLVLATMSVFVGHRFFINAKSGAKNISSLGGRKVAATLGTNIQFLADLVLDKAGVQVELVNVAPGDTVPALARGDVDAAFMFDTFYPQARAVLKENAIEIMTPDYKGQFLIVASREFASNNPGAVRLFLKGLLEADKMVAANKDDAVSAVSASTGGNLAPQSVNEQWANYHYEVNLNADLIPLMLAEGKWINSRGLIQAKASEELIRSYIDTKTLSELDGTRVRL